MSKRKYSATPVKKVNQAQLLEAVRGRRVVFGVDVAKYKFMGVFATDRATFLLTVSWTAPEETRTLVALLGAVRDSASQLDVAMESTGTYGDPLRCLVEGLGVPVYLVSAKAVHDASEEFDGVPSSHDPKAAAIIAQRHWDGRSEPWLARSDAERDLVASVEMLAMHQRAFRALIQQLEAKLARHFPEVTELLELPSATLSALLSKYPSPALIAAHAKEADALMVAVGRNMLVAEKRLAVLAAARASTGTPMRPREEQMLTTLTLELTRLRRGIRDAEKAVEREVKGYAPAQRIAEVVGSVTGAVLVVKLGDPGRFASASAYVKALGLNLKEHSSGQLKGRLAITKRGPGQARALLFLAVLRLLQSEPLFTLWFARKVERDGGKKLPAITALMRKLAGSLWHIAKGSAFDAKRLFDARRLTTSASTADSSPEPEPDLDRMAAAMVASFGAEFAA